MAQTKKEIEPSENKVYQNIRTVLVTARQKATFPIGHTLCDQLSWSHYRLLMRIDNEPRREFYLKECAESKLECAPA